MKNIKKIVAANQIQEIYLTNDQFTKDLDTCLTIIKESSPRRPFYVCEYTSASLHTKIVHIFIKG
jgi:hypothetical protein